MKKIYFIYFIITLLIGYLLGLNHYNQPKTIEYTFPKDSVKRFEQNILSCENLDNEDNTYCVVNLEETIKYIQWLEELSHKKTGL